MKKKQKKEIKEAEQESRVCNECRQPLRIIPWNHRGRCATL